jgi:hypothetical protein
VIVVSIAIGLAYVLIATIAYVLGYRAVSHSPRALTLFALTAGVLRLLMGALVVIVFLLLVDDMTSRKIFVITFLVFYLLMLVFDVVFFIRSQKSN